MKTTFRSVGVGSGIIPAPTAQRVAVNGADLMRRAMDSPEVRRLIDQEVKRFVRDRFAEALRRGSNGTFTIPL